VSGVEQSARGAERETLSAEYLYSGIDAKLEATGAERSETIAGRKGGMAWSNPQTEAGSQVSGAEQSASGAELKVLSAERSARSNP